MRKITPTAEKVPGPAPGHGWMYLLVGVPVLTDIIESGGWPRSPREWVTEVTVGALIWLLVRRVSAQQRAVAALARSDALTGLLNRRSFDEAVEDECARARRSSQSLTLVYLDLDNFKQVNDALGHGKGDEVLRQLAQAIRRVVRDRVDRGFRLGGDEFALVLPGIASTQARVVIERILEHCARQDSVWIDGVLGASAGMVEYEHQETAADFVGRADQAMYLAKRSRSSTGAGRGRAG